MIICGKKTVGGTAPTHATIEAEADAKVRAMLAKAFGVNGLTEEMEEPPPEFETDPDTGEPLDLPPEIAAVLAAPHADPAASGEANGE